MDREDLERTGMISKIIEDEEGFVFPLVDANKCIECGICEKVCPVGYKDFIDEKRRLFYPGYNRS